MRLDRLIAEETYRPATVGTTLIPNRPGGATYTEARGNSPTPLQDADGKPWFVVGRSKADGTRRPAPDW